MRIKEKLLNVQVTESTEILHKFLTQSANNKRIPLLLSSKKLYTDLASVIHALNVILALIFSSVLEQRGSHCSFGHEKSKNRKRSG